MKTLLIILLVANCLFAQMTRDDTSTEPQPIILTQVNMQNLGSGTSSISYSFKVGENDKVYHAGYFGDGIRPFIKSNPESVVQLDKFKSKRIISAIGYAGVFVFGGIGIAVGLNNESGEMVYDPRQGKMIEKQEPNPTGLAFVGLAVVSLIVGGYNYFSAADYMINTVKVFNSNLNTNSSSSLNYNIIPKFDKGKSQLCLSIFW